MYVNYKKERKKKDPLFKLSELLRGNTYHAFKRMGYKKQTKTQKILGADFETVKKHIESQFLKGMTWENRSDNVWHIDHIIPISFAKTEEELLKLCSYNNLQPLWAKENIVKGGCVPVLSKLY